MINPILSTKQLRYTPDDALDQETKDERREELYGPRDKTWYQRLTGMSLGNHGMTVHSGECCNEAVDAPRNVALHGNFVERGMVSMLDRVLRNSPRRCRLRAKKRKKNAKYRAKLRQREARARELTEFRFANAEELASGLLIIRRSKLQEHAA